MQKPVGELLSQWQSYLTNISSNLMELSEQTEYQLIKLGANDAANGYTGITKVKAQQCVESVGALWRYYALLAEVYEKANSLFSKSSFLNNTEDDVRQLLENTDIVIEIERIAINERSLIGSENKERKAKPGELIKYMQETFESVCGVVDEISKASELLESRLKNIKKDIANLNSAAKHLGISSIPELKTEKVNEIERNPLQGSLELDKLIYSIEKFRASITDIERDYNYIYDAFERIKIMIVELNALALRSKEAVAGSQKLFKGNHCIRPVIGEDVLKSLQDWLKVLEKKLSEGQIRAVKIGISKLENECSLKLKAEEENYLINSKDYNDLIDLRGHFKALCAKAEILSSKGLLRDTALNDQIIKTKAALHASVIDLDECKQLIRKFEFTLKK